MNINSSKIIFAFWEPKNDIPPYLKLCMATWKKFLPEYELILLDYSNIWEYIDKKTFDNILYKFNYAQQADCLRCALLEKYGGIWFDLDTVITTEEFKNFLDIKSEFILLGHHIGFIIAKKHAKILRKWLWRIKRNLFIYRLFKDISFIKAKLELDKWDYVGNRILSPMLKKSKKKYFYKIPRIKVNALPEVRKYPSELPNIAYLDYYFNNNYSAEDFLADSKGIIYLHNSWTPDEYRKMPIKEFLSKENTMATLFRTILTEEEINQIE